MSLRDDGAQIKLAPAFLLLSIGELKLVYFYDLLISLLPPPACMQVCQEASQWPGARHTGLHPGPSLCGQISPQPIKRKPIVMVNKLNNNKITKNINKSFNNAGYKESV